MTSEKTIKTQLKMIIYGCIALLFCGFCLNALHIYTKRDSVRDEYERYKYIQSLEK